jgi:hypothetical protein
MNTAISSWTISEKRQVVAVAASPTVVVIVTAIILAVWQSEDFTLFGLFTLPLAYLTLFIFVLPALTVARRLGKESAVWFVATVSLSVFIPWGLIYLAYAATLPAQEHPPTSLVLCVLSLPTVVSAFVAAAVWWFFGRDHNAA